MIEPKSGEILGRVPIGTETITCNKSENVERRGQKDMKAGFVMLPEVIDELY